MNAISIDLRVRVLADCDRGMGTLAVAVKYSVSPAWVRRFKQRRRETGQIGPKQQRRGPVPASVTYAEQIRAAVQTTPDATLAEYLEHLKLPLSRAGLARALLALGLSRKKRRKGPASKIAPT
jgi:transposase